MDIPAISCPSCNANVESANHIFFECDIATDIWKLVFRWCDIPLFQASSWDSFNDWIISWHASKEKKHRIPTTVPVTTSTIDPPVFHDDTLLILTETPTISPITSTIPPTAPTTHYISPFIHIDSSDDDTPDTPPSPTHEIPPVEVAPPTGQILPAPFGVHRRRRVGPLPTHRLAMRHTVDYSSSDFFTSDDSSRDSPSDSSSETPSDSYSDALSDSSSGHSSSDHSSPALPSGMRSSHQLCSSVSSIPGMCLITHTIFH
ncbi:hypothetical protein Tco_1050139 [Tanacetum coccineum]